MATGFIAKKGQELYNASASNYNPSLRPEIVAQTTNSSIINASHVVASDQFVWVTGHNNQSTNRIYKFHANNLTYISQTTFPTGWPQAMFFDNNELWFITDNNNANIRRYFPGNMATAVNNTQSSLQSGFRAGVGGNFIYLGWSTSVRKLWRNNFTQIQQAVVASNPIQGLDVDGGGYAYIGFEGNSTRRLSLTNIQINTGIGGDRPLGRPSTRNGDFLYMPCSYNSSGEAGRGLVVQNGTLVQSIVSPFFPPNSSILRFGQYGTQTTGVPNWNSVFFVSDGGGTWGGVSQYSTINGRLLMHHHGFKGLMNRNTPAKSLAANSNNVYMVIGSQITRISITNAVVNGKAIIEETEYHKEGEI